VLALLQLKLGAEALWSAITAAVSRFELRHRC
jgi:hypothetical protein